MCNWSSYDIRDVVDLCLVPDKVIAPEFKGLEFHKNKETSFLKRHLNSGAITLSGTKQRSTTSLMS